MGSPKINLDAVSEEERERIIARRAYKKQWRAKNRERVAEYDRRFWDKQAEKQKSAPAERKAKR